LPYLLQQILSLQAISVIPANDVSQEIHCVFTLRLLAQHTLGILKRLDQITPDQGAFTRLDQPLKLARCSRGRDRASGHFQVYQQLFSPSGRLGSRLINHKLLRFIYRLLQISLAS
jgi:hypothetical protein